MASASRTIQSASDSARACLQRKAREVRFGEVLDVHSMPPERLAEIAAAYGVTDVGGSFSDRERLRVGLQEGSFGVWSLERLNAHREKSGGSWKELRPGKRRKLADE